MENPNISYDLRGLAWFSPKLSCYLDENERCWLKMSPGWCGKLFFVNHDAHVWNYDTPPSYGYFYGELMCLNYGS